MKMYQLIGHKRGETDVIGYYKDEATASRVANNNLCMYSHGIQTNHIEVEVKRIPMYAHEHDITFIMNRIRYKDECILEECIGWYNGEPDDELTNKAENYGLIAEYF